MIGPGAAPPVRPPLVRWVRKNLFRSVWDGLTTIVIGALALYVVYSVVRFVVIDARWQIIGVNLKLLMVGRWPVGRLPALASSVVALALWGGLVAGVIAGRQRRRGAYRQGSMTWSERVGDLVMRFGLLVAAGLMVLALTTSSGPWLMVGAAIAAAVAGRLAGEWLGNRVLGVRLKLALALVLLPAPLVVLGYLTTVEDLSRWEGFFFNLTVAAASIILCFPLGVLLALGRQTKLRLIRVMSVLYIEFVRAAPLFVLLLMANVSLEFFVPEGIAPSKVIRALVTFTLFTAAYLAEIVRGGLQAVPRGQVEAAKSLGLSPTRQTALIVLPQALRSVIPAQIGQFISLFKDTTLAGLALGIFDFLRGAQAITQQESFRGQGLIVETLVFVAFIFWVGSFTMSRESQRLERKLGVGER